MEIIIRENVFSFAAKIIILSLFFFFFAVPFCFGDEKSDNDGCALKGLSDDEIKGALEKYIEERVPLFKIHPELNKIEVDEMGCEYIVKLIFIPERPGGVTIYKINRSRRVVDKISGY